MELEEDDAVQQWLRDRISLAEEATGLVVFLSPASCGRADQGEPDR